MTTSAYENIFRPEVSVYQLFSDTEVPLSSTATTTISSKQLALPADYKCNHGLRSEESGYFFKSLGPGARGVRVISEEEIQTFRAVMASLRYIPLPANAFPIQ